MKISFRGVSLTGLTHSAVSSTEQQLITFLYLFAGFKLIPFGSLTTGVIAKSSDVDISFQLPNFNSSADSYVLQETKKLFLNQPALYSNVRGLILPVFAFASFFHIPSQQEVDLVFKNGEAVVHKSMLVKYYFNLDERYQPMARFLKLWFTIHGLAGHGRDDLKNYGLYLMIIFYLQQKNMVPPAYVLQRHAITHVINNWDMGFNELPYKSTNTDSLYQLLGGFFKYYSEFNYEECIIAPFTGRPVPRSALIDIDNFPKEYTLYKNTLETTIQLAIKNRFKMSSVCIQDSLEHDVNVGDRLPKDFATKLKQAMKSVASMFEYLPRETILRAALTDGHKEPAFIANNATVEQDCFEIS